MIMGFTHRQPAAAEATLRQIASLGFDFSKTAPASGAFKVPAVYPTLYTQGVFFAGDCNRKGDVFMPFVAKTGTRPKKVVFIDDKRKNIDELEVLLEKEGIDYVGVHYTAIFKAAPVYVREIAEFQYEFLDRILSNEEALTLMERGIAKESAESNPLLGVCH